MSCEHETVAYENAEIDTAQNGEEYLQVTFTKRCEHCNTELGTEEMEYKKVGR